MLLEDCSTMWHQITRAVWITTWDLRQELVMIGTLFIITHNTPINEPHGSRRVNVGWERLSPPSHDFQNNQSTAEDPDGEPLEIDDEDPELTRKRKELREIEEQIMQKKFALALKQVEPFVKKTAPGFACNEQSSTHKGETLRDRVNAILQQRCSPSFLSKSPKQRIKSSSLIKDGLLQENHPLKLRVKALIKQRCSDPCVLQTTTEVSGVTSSSLSQSVSSAEENSADKAFQRFLSVLNKGVDMDLLSRIVNNDSDDLPLGEELLNIQLPTRSRERSESQQSISGASLPGLSHTISGESKAEPPIQERSHSDGLAMPHGKEKKNDRGSSSFGSRSRSKSPAAVKKKKKKGEEEKAHFDEQHEQLRNILKTLGLNLEVEEMSKLTDRTQERLYGKKSEARHRTDRGEQERRQRASHEHYRNSSSSSYSSSSSSSSSRSTSRSFSVSPPRRRRADSRDLEQSQASECSGSRDRSRDRLKTQGSNQDSKEPQTPRDREKDGKGSQKISAYQQAPDQTYPHPHPPAPPSFLDHTLSQYSQCPQSTFQSEAYNAATNSYWTYTQNSVSASLYPQGLHNSQNTYHHFPGSVMPPHRVYQDRTFDDIHFLVNPDLSMSEGQTGSVSATNCLQVINTMCSDSRNPNKRVPCLKQLTKRKKRRKIKCYVKWRQRRKLRKKQKKAENCKKPVQSVDVSQPGETEQSEEEEEDKQQLTEEEIKANLKKKLEAFNQKVKQKVAQPANSQMLKSVECEDCL
ncbi:zinc finger protein 318-like [Anabas testudineus]|uniref:zinc finger protein 318-like n=1 Tax=Anabas testudineus TaxID=64144 RepID=UPI000E4603E2|nr:zinc finger protein 318-like [Anabas testudineus]XP_026216660.1 zinc finger protein 318-like [Anabas testudineus]XP_026216661.1 zinc finger protein 318-like [Anabas testudineus]XP_026216662.1 zinc finger protein 318-like [Anabas testudineus]